ncbi:class Ib ribonucleoside-diphosphate reductase assembly flavoprotein NrdI [Shouchella patagoniensis]|uniref:class Ib ribonucleoside-diphosphate reductase assembly flavoprotein NrdI n=1 Tax=Shouchella patagoniensis TaxID=228576 RepID=UPI0009959455|nr:class Ib ribonucleoside-diphosphate reductase assembly flavoprotein NrdI [Shouchella patagoniensis]
MKIVFDSRTGNVKRFAAKLPFDCEQINDSTYVDEPFVLITYTTGFGDLSPKTRTFLENNYEWLKGVAASGNRIWGDRFARSADTIANTYSVPILHKFELSGTSKDVDAFAQEVYSIDTVNTKSSAKVGSA